jgi:hypothetical protein
LLPQIALADGALLSQATPVQREQAQSRFRRAKELMAKGRYDEAAAEFRASHDIVASPNTRLELGRCMRAQGRLVAAYAEFGRTMVEAKEVLAEDQRYQRAYDAAVAERTQLEPKLGFVALTIDNAAEGTRIVVGHEEIRRAAWGEPAPVEAGTTEVRISSPGHADVVRSVTVSAGGRVPLRLDAQSGDVPQATHAAEAPAPAPGEDAEKKPLPMWPAYVGYGAGATLLVTGLVVGFSSVASARNNANMTQTNILNAGGGCPSTLPQFAPSCAKYNDDISLINTDKAVAWTLGTTGVLLIGASTVWLVMTLPRAHAEGSASARGPMTLTPIVGPTLAGATLEGRF